MPFVREDDFFLEVFPPDSSSPWSDPKPSAATLAGNVAYVLGVKAVERLLTSVQFFASAPPYRKAVVSVNTNRRLHQRKHDNYINSIHDTYANTLTQIRTSHD